MKKLLRLSALLLLASLLGGCVLFHGYAPQMQQGNVLPVAKVNQLRAGLSKQDVLSILGSPVYTNTFSNRWVYVYSLEKYSDPIHTRQVIITFRNDHVSQIKKNMKVAPKKKYF